MLIRRSAKMLAENVDCAWPGFKKNLALRKTALESTLPPVPNENSVRPASDAIPRGEAKSVSRSRPCLSLANEICRCTRVQVSTVRTLISKTPRGGSSQPGRLWLFRQPVVRSGDATHRPAVPPRRTPFPAAESLVAPVSPSLTIDVFAIGDNDRNTN